MRVLVTAATRHGSTREIAAALAARLREHGLSVEVRAPQEVADLDGFDAIVLGSAVYAGRWLVPARGFVERLGDAIEGRPVWLFSSGPIGDPPKPLEEPTDVAGIAAATGARGHRVLAGRLDRDALGFAERALVRALRAPEGDFRDWTAVSAFADEVAAALPGEGRARSRPGPAAGRGDEREGVT